MIAYLYLVKVAHTTLIAERSTYNASMAKTENNMSGIIELYPPVGVVSDSSSKETTVGVCVDQM